MLKFNSTREFLRWHKRFGIVSAFFVLLLAATGLLLNHSHDLGLDKNYISSHTLLRLYGIEHPSISAVALDDDLLLQLNFSDLYYQSQALASCVGQLLASVRLQEMVVVVCENEILLFTSDMQLIEKVGEAAGLPQPIVQVGVMDELLILRSTASLLRADLDSLTWSPLSLLKNDAVVWLGAVSVTPSMRREVASFYAGAEISWERLLLDVHAGRFLGSIGKWLMDLVALLFILLSLTGLFLWLKKERKAKKRK